MKWQSLGGTESACQFRRSKRLCFNPWVRQRLWRRKWQSTPVFLPGKSRGAWQATVHGVSKSQTWLSVHACRYFIVKRVWDYWWENCVLIPLTCYLWHKRQVLGTWIWRIWVRGRLLPAYSFIPLEFANTSWNF